MDTPTGAYDDDYGVEPVFADSEYEAEPSPFLENIRENPTGYILAALGAGLLTGLLVRGSKPEPENRALRALEDLKEQLASAAQPAYKKARELAEDGSDAVRSGVDHLSDLPIEQTLKKLKRRLQKLL